MGAGPVDVAGLGVLAQALMSVLAIRPAASLEL